MRRFIITLAALLAVVGLGLAGYKFGLPAYRSWKEQRSLRQAREFLEKADFANAHLSIRNALSANPRSVEGARLMADLSDLARSPTALGWRQRVAELDPEVTNRLMYAAAALRFESPPFPQAARVVDELSTNGGPGRIEYHLVASQLAIKRNQLTNAEAHLREAIRLDPTNRLHEINLAVLRLQSADPASVAASQKTLESARTDPVHGLQALRSLVADHINNKAMPAAVACSDDLLARPDAGVGDRLQHLALLRESKNPAFAPFLGQLQAGATNAPLAYDVGLAMIGLDEGDAALRWLLGLPEVLRKEMPLPLAVSEAYMALKDWKGLETYLQAQDWKDADFVRLGMLFRAQHHQEGRTTAALTWEKAERLAGARLPTLLALLQMVQKWELPGETESVLETIVNRFPSQRWAVPALEESLARRGNTRGLNRLYKLELDRNPDDAALKNNVSATAMLLNTDLKRAHVLAKEAWSKIPTNAGFASTYAWSLHMQGRTAEGVKIMEEIPARDLQHPSIAAYYGALLVASGQPDKAAPFLDRAEKAPLLPEEREIVKAAKK